MIHSYVDEYRRRAEINRPSDPTLLRKAMLELAERGLTDSDIAASLGLHIDRVKLVLDSYEHRRKPSAPNPEPSPVEILKALRAISRENLSEQIQARYIARAVNAGMGIMNIALILRMDPSVIADIIGDYDGE